MKRKAVSPPFGLSPVQPAFDRATRVAKTLFRAFDSSIVLMEGGQAWRSRDPGGLPARDPAADIVMSTGEPIWIENASEDPLVRDDPLVQPPMSLRFYAGAPVRLADGSSPGVLCVIGREPRPYDAALARCLQDLADGVAYECERAKAARDAAEAGAELRSTQAILKAFVETVPVSLMMTDREFRLLSVSPRWLRNTGLVGEQVIGRTPFELKPEYFARWRDTYDRCLAGETIRTPRARADIDGERRWLQSEMTPWRDKSGEIGGIVAAAFDITEMVLAIKRMEQSESRLKMAMELADVHVWELDYKRRTLEKAGAEDTFFEQPKTYADLYKDITCTIDARDKAHVLECWDRHVKEGVPYGPEYRIARTDGKEVWVLGAVKYLADDQGRPSKMYGAMQNVTARKQAELALVQAKEDAEAANRAKSTFLATMSHEIRTPLNGVLGMAQAMAVDALEPVQRERLAIIRQSGETLLHILNDVLDLSKIEAGRLELEEGEFDLAELARGAHATFSAVAEAKDLAFELTVEPNARGVYRGDSTRVRQILYNLVSNALKFTERGSVRVKVASGRKGLRITVSDTGIGIDAERKAALFKKFEQADASTTRRFGGTGLGLAIVQELTSLMGGRIDVKSKAGGGTSFVVNLPLARIADERLGPTTAEAAAEESAEGLRVLAAEDNAVNRMVLKTLFGQVGILPMIVENGVQAVKAWEDGAWDVVLMDVQMPEMDGPTATRLIREKEKATGRARTPILALTANAMSHQVADYLACGMDDVVAKPIQISELFGTINRVLAATAANDSEAA